MLNCDREKTKIAHSRCQIKRNDDTRNKPLCEFSSRACRPRSTPRITVRVRPLVSTRSTESSGAEAPSSLSEQCRPLFTAIGQRSSTGREAEPMGTRLDGGMARASPVLHMLGFSRLHVFFRTLAFACSLAKYGLGQVRNRRSLLLGSLNTSELNFVACLC